MKLVYRSRDSGISIIEVLVCIVILGIVFGGAISAYIQSARRAEWSAYSLAAHSVAIQRIEQTRAAKWDLLASPPVDELVSTNFPPVIEVLDVPIVGTNVVYTTNTITVTDLSSDPPLKMVRSESVWTFLDNRIFTNSLTVYRAPDQ